MEVATNSNFWTNMDSPNYHKLYWGHASTTVNAGTGMTSNIGEAGLSNTTLEKCKAMPRSIKFDKKHTTHVTFCDGSTQSVKLQYGDVFDERTGIALALIFNKFGNKKNFYKELDAAMKVLKNQRKEEERVKVEKDLEKKRKEKLAKRREKSRRREEERQIWIQTEAYIRAMKILKQNK